MADKKKKPDLGLLEEDDEFEEFPAQGYNRSLSCLDIIILYKYFLHTTNDKLRGQHKPRFYVRAR